MGLQGLIWEAGPPPLAGILKTPRERLWLAPGPFATSVGPHRAVRLFGTTAISAEGFVGSLAPLARTPGPLGSGWPPRPMTGPGPFAIGKPRGRYGHPAPGWDAGIARVVWIGPCASRKDAPIQIRQSILVHLPGPCYIVFGSF